MSEQGIYASSDSSLSTAWARCFLEALSRRGHELTPCLVSITGFTDGVVTEEMELRAALDACLEEAGQQLVEKVAKSIFPQALWRRANGDRQKLYKDYLTALPDYVAMEPSKNGHGMYFARLIAFGTDPRTGQRVKHLPASAWSSDGNQIEFIIQHCQKGKRRAMLQAAVYDPVRDLTGAAQQGFPCLQHITFVPDFTEGTLTLNAFYATQQLFVKAYGNWLGLCRLGAFIADQTGLRFNQLCCYAGIQKMDSGMRPKRGARLDRLIALSRACIQTENVGSLVGAKDCP